ncbi:unnamed protein product [Cyprideis torosa]|uniref:Uncharacterized protein n=1 Tax=Cyprideis torosa TaxID=163714 RepID=A0A7R8ZLC1_9CRUS|nr:unnamed protein product [Cyprideis torosa]CAG0886310.1 unnamed protein product [Cyprideis torosa]
MKKEERGSMSMAEVSTEQGEKVFLVRWMDNSVVTTASTTFGSHPVNKVQRWSQAKKDRIRISCPQSIQQYNASMGGTDRQDQNANTYRVQIRGKKWFRLTGHQLKAAAHFVRRQDADIIDDSETQASDSSTTAATAQTQEQLPRRRGRGVKYEEAELPQVDFDKPTYSFKKMNSIPSIGTPVFPDGDFSRYKDFSPHELVELFWANDFLEEVIKQINLYCVFKQAEEINTNVGELRVFLGVRLLSGYNPMPQRFLRAIASYCILGTLHQNNLTALPVDLFDSMSHLRMLRLAENQLNCDCHLSWLARWLRRNPRLALFAKCAEPLPVQGRGVAELRDSEFKCPGEEEDRFPRSGD